MQLNTFYQMIKSKCVSIFPRVLKKEASNLWCRPHCVFINYLIEFIKIVFNDVLFESLQVRPMTVLCCQLYQTIKRPQVQITANHSLDLQYICKLACHTSQPLHQYCLTGPQQREESNKSLSSFTLIRQ